LKQQYDLVVVVNPNNPTGGHVRRGDLQEVLATAPASTRFWIDEAYVDYVGPDQSLEQFAAASQNVVVCKSMSKAYALSGARAAYLCGPRKLAGELRSITPPWVIGLPAQIAAVRALQDPAYYELRYDQTRTLREHLSAELTELGLMVLRGEANFVLCRSMRLAAPELIARCRPMGLFLRDVSSMMTSPEPGLFRIAVKDSSTNARMIEILRDVLSAT
jgi:histidinol-phosphate/aromatic aminotransferase/cobyric acid decarboxylase-like protein